MLFIIMSMLFYFICFKVTLIVEEHTRQLLKINRQFGNSLLSAVTFCQESDSFQDQVKVSKILLYLCDNVLVLLAAYYQFYVSLNTI